MRVGTPRFRVGTPPFGVRLAYGKSGLWINLPDAWGAEVVEPRFVPGLANPCLAIAEALRNPIGAAPLCEIAKPSDRVGVVFSDITRPTPNRLILPRVLEALAHLPKHNVTLFNALGTHRPNTVRELCGMLGDDIVAEYRIVQNDAFDPATQVCVGRSSRGHEIWLNRELMACDAIVLTGFIEPHFFAGFSGGGKAIMPGMAGQRTVLGNHDAAMIGNPKAAWGITRGNPIWEEIREVASVYRGRCPEGGTTFLLNVTLNRDKQVTGVFSGDLDEAHYAGCEFARTTAMVAVPRPFDIVVSTNSGYPLDQNLYQSVKGISAAAQVVRDGGAIIIATECRDGVPDHGLYGRLLSEAGSPQAVLDTVRSPGFLRQDQWQVQIQAQIQLRADVHVYSDHLTDEQIRAALLKPCRSIEQTIAALRERHGPGAALCVLPEGPQTIPYVE